MIISVAKNTITYLPNKKGELIVLYNLSAFVPIEVIGGPNSLVHFKLKPRSGVSFISDSQVQVMAAEGDSIVDFESFEDSPALKGSSLEGKKFYVDAGHGGTDPGAVNNNLGLQEKIAALDIALFLGEEFESAGAEVYFSRSTDFYPSLSARTSQANNLGVDCFISIHLNSADSKSAEGIETLCYTNKGTSYELAKAVQDYLIMYTGFKDRGVKLRPDLHVLRATKMPAILVETGFISNDEEAKKLFSEKYQKLIANSIYLGVLDIFGG